MIFLSHLILIISYDSLNEEIRKLFPTMGQLEIVKIFASHTVLFATIQLALII